MEMGAEEHVGVGHCGAQATRIGAGDDVKFRRDKLLDEDVGGVTARWRQ